ncbi:MAG: alpha/beta hydrolase [Alphaproteobacteria bacterium]|nr:alpha/beta hydrolase [Alphaproteobacteria bacterium]
MEAETQRPSAGRTSDSGASPRSTLDELSARSDLPKPSTGYLDAADGVRLRYAHWPTPEKTRQGTVLYLNGRTEFIEKTMAAYAILCRSGFDVWTFDWRGQGLSTRALADPQKGHITDYQLFLDDLHQVISELIDLPDGHGKTILLGHSMGGHLGLRYLHDHPGLFDAAAFSAPMIDIPVNGAPLRALNAVIVGLGFGESYALGTGRFRPIYDNPSDPADNGELEDYRRLIDSFEALGSDARKRMEIERLVRDHPALALGGPTAAWLGATFRSINLTWTPGYAEAIETPVLMVSGGRDRVVIAARQEAMAKRLLNGRFHQIDKAAHELLVECDDVRFAFFEQVAAFVDVRIDQPAIDMEGCIRR